MKMPWQKLKDALNSVDTQLKTLRTEVADNKATISSLYNGLVTASSELEATRKAALSASNDAIKKEFELIEKVKLLKIELAQKQEQLEQKQEQLEQEQEQLEQKQEQLEQECAAQRQQLKEQLYQIDNDIRCSMNDKLYKKDIEFVELQMKLCDLEVPNNKARYLALQNKHKGEKCFIIGNGPSLKMEDLETLRKNNIVTFASNKIYLAFEKVEWRPTYYMCQDFMYLEQFWKEITNVIPTKNAFLPQQTVTELNKKSDNEKTIYFPFKYRNTVPVWFSCNLDCAIHEGMTITFSAMQMAVFMGFTEIYLLGVDNDYATKIDEHGRHVVDVERASHFDANYRSKSEVINHVAYEEMLQGYVSAKEYGDNNGIKIANASAGGKLEVYPRVAFKDVIDCIKNS